MSSANGVTDTRRLAPGRVRASDWRGGLMPRASYELASSAILGHENHMKSRQKKTWPAAAPRAVGQCEAWYGQESK